MDDLKQQAQRLKALWKSGRDKYASFFTVLREVKTEVGDSRLADWCFDELRIGLPVILRYRDLLDTTDDQIVKADLAAAVAIDKKEREELKHRRDLEKARKATEVAHARAGAARVKAASDADAARIKAESAAELARINNERKKVQDAEKARQQKRKNPNERGHEASAKRTKRALVAKISDAELADLAKRFEAAETMCANGVTQWIEGSIAKALILAAARDRFTADQDFGAWVDQFRSVTKPLGRDERAALIGLGRLGKPRLREILSSTESRSYQLIWREQKPKLALVEAGTAACSANEQCNTVA